MFCIVSLAVAAARGDMHAVPLRDVAAEQVFHVQHPVGVDADVDRVEPAADQEFFKRVYHNGLSPSGRNCFGISDMFILEPEPPARIAPKIMLTLPFPVARRSVCFYIPGSCDSGL